MKFIRSETPLEFSCFDYFQYQVYLLLKAFFENNIGCKLKHSNSEGLAVIKAKTSLVMFTRKRK